MEKAKPEHQKDPTHRPHQDGGGKQPSPGRGRDDSAVGKDTDNDGRVVKPGHKPGEVDGPRSR